MVKGVDKGSEMDNIYGFMPIVGPALLAVRMANRYFGGDGASEKGGSGADASDDGKYASKFNDDAVAYRNAFLEGEEKHRSAFLMGEQEHRDAFLERMYGKVDSAKKRSGSAKTDSYDKGAGKDKPKKDNYNAGEKSGEESDGSNERGEDSGDLEKKSGGKGKKSGSGRSEEDKGSNYDGVLAEVKKEYDAARPETEATYGKEKVDDVWEKFETAYRTRVSDAKNKGSGKGGEKPGSKKSDNLEERAKSGATKATRGKGKGTDYEAAAGDNYDSDGSDDGSEKSGDLEEMVRDGAGSSDVGSDTSYDSGNVSSTYEGGNTGKNKAGKNVDKAERQEQEDQRKKEIGREKRRKREAREELEKLYREQEKVETMARRVFSLNDNYARFMNGKSVDKIGLDSLGIPVFYMDGSHRKLPNNVEYLDDDERDTIVGELRAKALTLSELPELLTDYFNSQKE